MPAQAPVTGILAPLFFLVTAASWVYWLLALVLVRRFFGADDQERAPSGFAPPVSILKPVKGVDFDAYENFASFCDQDYPRYEVVFGVNNAADPAVALIERLQNERQSCRIRLVKVVDARGANRKAGLLDRLAAAAGHDLLVVNDSDMRVGPDYLRRVVGPLAEEGVGLVTCLYRAEAPHSFTARLEALHMGLSFLPSVLVGRLIVGMRFALSASNSLHRRDLDAIGGFAALADYLADDYQLGARISASGRRIHLSRYLMVTHLGATTFREQWGRELRWAGPACRRRTRLAAGADLRRQAHGRRPARVRPAQSPGRAGRGGNPPPAPGKHPLAAMGAFLGRSLYTDVGVDLQSRQPA